MGNDVLGKKLGLIGFVKIAQKVALRARGFDMKVRAYAPYISRIADERLAQATLFV